MSTLVSVISPPASAKWVEATDPSLFRRPRTWWFLVALFLITDSGGLFTTQGMHPGAGIGQGGNGEVDQSAASVSIMLNSIWVICMGLMFGFARPILNQMAKQKVVLSFLVLAFLSTFWSQAPNMTIRKSILLALYLLFAWYFTSYYTPADQMRLLIALGVIMGVASVFWAIALPGYGVHGTGEWKGIFGQKNMLGTAMLFLFSPLPFRPIANFRELRRVCLIGLLPIGLIMLSQSRTSLIMAVILVALRICGPIFIGLKKERMPLVVFLLVIGLAMIPISIGIILPLLGRDLTFSDRTTYWALLVPYAKKHLWLGYGYQAFFVDRAGQFGSVTGITSFKELISADNGYLDVWLECGLVGVATLFALFAASVSDFFAVARRPRVPLAAFWYAGLILSIYFGGITDNIFWKPIRMMPFILAAACAGLANIKTNDTSPVTTNSQSYG